MITTTDGSKTQYSYAPEVSPGVAPTGAYQALRSTVGVQFPLTRATFVSKERRADRMEPAMSYGNKSGTANIPVEWSFGSYDDFLEAVLGGTWAANTLKVGNTKRTFTFEETATDIGITEQKMGVQMTSLSLSQKVNTIASGSITGLFLSLDAPQTKGVNLAYDATAKTITRATAGFMTVDGWVVGSAVLGLGNTDAGNNNAAPFIITTLTDSIMTFAAMAGAVTKLTTAGIVLNQGTLASALTPALITPPFDSFTGTITEGGVVIGYVTGWDIKVDQTSQANFANGSDSAQSISIGTIKVTGTITVYYVDQALRKKFISGTASSLSLVMGSVAATKAYTIDLGTVKYTANTRDDVELARMETLTFAATYTAVDGTIKITRTP